ncbi:putative ribonuclease H-like domain-containing protein [Tanacetum coccineum]
MTHPSTKRNMVPKPVLIRSGLVSLTTARPVKTAQPRTIVNTARPKAVFNDVKGNQVNAIKASACWVWKPITKVIDHVSKDNSASIILKKFDYDNPLQDLQEKGVIYSGCSRHMKENMSYLTDFEEIDRGYVTFGGNPIGGKITGRDQRVKVIRCDNRTEFKNKEMNQFGERKSIKREFSVARTPQQNGAKVVNTTCYVQNRVLVIKPHNKTPYELFLGRKPALGFMRPFGCPVTILNTIDHLGKFDGKADEGFFVGYLINSKAYRVFNNRTRIVKENIHVQFSENIPNIIGSGPNWLFDIDSLTKSMNYKPVEKLEWRQYLAKIPLWTSDPPFSQSSKSSPNAGFKPSGDDGKKVDENPRKESKSNNQEKEDNVNSTNNVNAASTNKVNVVGGKTSIELLDDPNISELEDIVYPDDDKDVGVEADMNNLDAFMHVSPIPTTRIHKDHPVEQIIRDLNSAPQTRRMTKNLKEHGLFSSVQQRTNHKDFQNCLFACFLSQEEPKKVIHALKDSSWIKAMQEELLQFKNKKDERGIVIKNKARLVAQGYTQEEGIDYDEVFAPVARIEAIRLFLAYASFKDLVVYQMDVKSDFIYGKIEEEVYVCQLPGFEDPDFPDRVYKVENALYGLHQAPRAWYETLSTYLLDNEFQRGTIDKTLFIIRDRGDILLVQVYVDDIIFGSTKKSLCTEFEKMMHKKFQMSSMGKLTFFLGLFTDVKTASTPMETQKPLLKDEDGEEVDVYLYRSMIGSLMYFTSSRPDIMFAVYSLFDLVAYTDSAYARASLDRKSTIEGCQILGSRLISWQCKKKTLVANSTTEAEYVAASSCCGQVLWIQNQLLDYGYNFLHTKIFIDNNINAARHKLTTAVEVNAARHKLTTDFWSTEKAKTVNGEVQLQALVDGKKIIVTEASVRHDLQLDDEEGMDCLPNATIFEELTRMRYEKISQRLTFYKAFFSSQWKFLIHTTLQCLSAKTTAWNEFSSTMASAIIYLATIEKFNFSKYIFESIVRNVENVFGKFLMYPRFLQVFVNQQVGDMSNHKRIYVSSSHTKKIFGNMKREGKGFSGRVTPLFPTIMVQAQEEICEGSANPTDPHHTPTIIQPSSSQPQKKQKPRKPKRKDTEVPQPSGPTTNIADEAVNEENVSKHSNDPLLSGEDSLKLEELMALCITLQQRDVAEKEVSTADPVTTAGEVFTTVSVEVSTASPTEAIIADELTLAQTLIEIKSAKPKVKGVVIDEQSEFTTRTRPQRLPLKDKGKGIMVEPEKPIKKKDQIRLDEELAFMIQAEEEEELLAKRLQAREQEELTDAEKATLFVQILEKRRKHFAAKRVKEKRNRPPTKAQKRIIMSTYLKNMAGYKHNQLKNKIFDDIQKLFDKEMKRVNIFVDMDETTELRSLVEVIPNEEEVAIDAIPLATKPPSIMLKNFDREDLETLWKLVKAKHGSTRPEEGYESVLWDMLNRKLQADHWNEMCYHLLKFIKSSSRINEGRIVGIKRLHDDLEVTAAKVKVTAAKQNLVLFITTAERLQLLEEFMLTEKRSKTYQRKDKDYLEIKITVISISYL